MNKKADAVFGIFPVVKQLMKYVGPQNTTLGASLKLTPVHHQSLLYIYMKKDCKMADLAKELFVSPPAITRIIDKLIDKGLVERNADKVDRRIIRLRMTEKGRRTLEEGRREVGILMEELLSRMEKEDYNMLIRGAKALSEALKNKESESK